MDFRRELCSIFVVYKMVAWPIRILSIQYLLSVLYFKCIVLTKNLTRQTKEMFLNCEDFSAAYLNFFISKILDNYIFVRKWTNIILFVAIKYKLKLYAIFIYWWTLLFSFVITANLFIHIYYCAVKTAKFLLACTLNQ